VVGVADAEGHVRLRRDQARPWVAYPDLQTAECDPFAKAHRAGDGRILLGRAEGLVFTAEATDRSSAFGACSYEISGTTPPSGSGRCGSAMRMVNRSPRRNGFRSA
jgi:hypothetical protein